MAQSELLPDFLNDTLGFNLDRVAQLFRLELMQALATYDLTPEQWQIMALLWHNPGPLKQRDITQLLSKDKHNISRMVRRLEDKGWLERTGDLHSRTFFVRPTELGQRHKDAVLETLSAHFGNLELGLDLSQRRELVTLLKVVRTYLSDGRSTVEADGK